MSQYCGKLKAHVTFYSWQNNVLLWRNCADLQSTVAPLHSFMWNVITTHEITEVKASVIKLQGKHLPGVTECFRHLSGPQGAAQTLTLPLMSHLGGYFSFSLCKIRSWRTRNTLSLKKNCLQLNQEEASTVCSLLLHLHEAIYLPFEVCSRNQLLIPITLATTALFPTSSSRSKESRR